MTMMKKQLMHNIIREMQESASFQKALTIESVDNGFVINKLHIKEEEMPKAFIFNPGAPDQIIPAQETEEEEMKRVPVPTIKTSVAKDADEALSIIKTYLESASLILKEKK